MPSESQGGEVLGPYRLLEELGSGAMGAVYRARDDERTVAVKVIHPHIVGREGFFRRFQREAEAGRRIEHPNVVQTFGCDVLALEGGLRAFLVMEYVEGRTLRDLLGELGRVPEALVREIGRQVAEGLAAVHGAGVVHRDLKPENVLITEDHEVRIMDLGVARFTDATSALTREGQFAGSLHYAAPEQFRPGAVGPAADLYALGVVLYELASGTNPFRYEEAAATVHAHLEDSPGPLDRVVEDVSPLFAEVVATLLAKEPAERFESAGELAGVLALGQSSSWWSARELDALERRAGVPRIPVRRETDLRGRESELSFLRAQWVEAHEGRGVVALLEGEAGIGKTRLVDEFLHEVADGAVHVLYGSYAPWGGPGAISEAACRRFGDEGLEAALQPYMSTAPGLAGPLAATLRHEASAEGKPALSTQALQAALAHLIRGLAAESPIVWVIEDLQFAQDDGRSLALSLARAVAGHRILLLLTSRPELPDAYLAELGRVESMRRSGLGRLGARDIILLLEDAFRSRRLAEKLGGKIALKSDGIPFFVFEMIRGLREGQFITQLPDGSYVETQEIEEIQVPSTVRALVEVRLGELTGEQRATLDLGAVLGFEFDPLLIAGVRERSAMEVLEALAAVERGTGLIQTTSTNYRFDHHQIQEVLYGQLHERLREAYHTALAQAIEGQRDPEEDGEVALTVCEHYLKGAEFNRAERYLAKAHRHATQHGLYERCGDMIDRALELGTDMSPELRCRALLWKSELLDIHGRHDEQEAVLERAAELAEAAVSTELQTQVLGHQGQLFRSRGELDGALVKFEMVLANLSSDGDAVALADAHGRIGSTLLMHGRKDEARVHFERVRELSHEAGYESGEATALGNLGALTRYDGRLEEARGLLSRARRILQCSGRKELECLTMLQEVELLQTEGQLREAEEVAEEVLQVSRAAGYRPTEARALSQLGLLIGCPARCDEAIGIHEQSLALYRELGDRRGECTELGNLGRALVFAGRASEALVRHEQEMQLAEDLDQESAVIRARFGLGEVEMILGRLGDAQSSLSRACSLAEQHGDSLGEVRARLKLANCMTLLGEHERAEEYAIRALALTRSVGYQPYEIDLLWCRMSQAGQRHDLDAVQRYHDEAKRVLGAGQDENLRATRAFIVGHVHAERGETDEAASELSVAWTLARENGWLGLAAVAGARLVAMGALDPRDVQEILEDRGDWLDESTRLEVNFLLWKAGGEVARLREAKRLLDHLVEHAPAEHRTSLVEGSPLPRELAAAWARHSETCPW